MICHHHQVCGKDKFVVPMMSRRVGTFIIIYEKYIKIAECHMAKSPYIILFVFVSSKKEKPC